MFACFAALLLACTPEARAQGRDAAGYTDRIRSVFSFIQNHYVDEVDAEKLYEGAMKGMLDSLGDPYSVFLPKSELADLNQSVIQGNYGGVGLYVSKVTREGEPAYLEIASPIEDTPGWRAGLQPGDLIISVDGTGTDELSQDEAVSRLKGPAGESVEVVIRRGAALEFPVTLVREVIEVPTVKHAMMDSDTGYVRLITFSNFTAERTEEALKDLLERGAKNIVLDLRNNYGGLLNSAVDVSSLFLKEGLVVSVKSRIAGQNAEYKAGRRPLVPENMPVVVLINRASASASEIVAGALKDRRRAYLVGEKSFGKGSVQQVYPINETGFKITTARYYSPSDANIDKIGIPPDREILFPEYSEEDAEALNKLLQDKRISSFVKDNPRAAQTVIDRFVKEISGEYHIAETLLRRMVRDEQTRTDMPRVFDMEYDVQLQEAVKILKEGGWRNLVQSTKTLKEIELENAAANALAESAG